MTPFSRALRRVSLFRFGAAALGLAWLAVLAAFAYSAAAGRPGVSSLVAAAVLLVIAAACFLYAWREPGA